MDRGGLHSSGRRSCNWPCGGRSRPASRSDPKVSAKYPSGHSWAGTAVSRPEASTTTTTSTSASRKPVGIARERVPSASVRALVGNVIILDLIISQNTRAQPLGKGHRGAASNIASNRRLSSLSFGCRAFACEVRGSFNPRPATCSIVRPLSTDAAVARKRATQECALHSVTRDRTRPPAAPAPRRRPKDRSRATQRRTNPGTPAGSQ